MKSLLILVFLIGCVRSSDTLWDRVAHTSDKVIYALRDALYAVIDGLYKACKGAFDAIYNPKPQKHNHHKDKNQGHKFTFGDMFVNFDNDIEANPEEIADKLKTGYHFYDPLDSFNEFVTSINRTSNNITQSIYNIAPDLGNQLGYSNATMRLILDNLSKSPNDFKRFKRYAPFKPQKINLTTTIGASKTTTAVAETTPILLVETQLQQPELQQRESPIVTTPIATTQIINTSIESAPIATTPIATTPITTTSIETTPIITTTNVTATKTVVVENDNKIKGFLSQIKEQLNNTITSATRIINETNITLVKTDNDSADIEQIVQDLLKGVDSPCKTEVENEIKQIKETATTSLFLCIYNEVQHISGAANLASTILQDVNQAIAERNFEMTLIQSIVEKFDTIKYRLTPIQKNYSTCRNECMLKLHKSSSAIALKIFECRALSDS